MLNCFRITCDPCLSRIKTCLFCWDKPHGSDQIKKEKNYFEQITCHPCFSLHYHTRSWHTLLNIILSNPLTFENVEAKKDASNCIYCIIDYHPFPWLWYCLIDLLGCFFCKHSCAKLPTKLNTSFITIPYVVWKIIVFVV